MLNCMVGASHRTLHCQVIELGITLLESGEMPFRRVAIQARLPLAPFRRVATGELTRAT